MGLRTCGLVWWGAAVGALTLSAITAHAQLQITEIMFDPVAETVWEWVEVRNTTAAAVNLHGWVLDDDDDGTMGMANIDSDNGNTMVPAGGVAVLYNAGDLNFEPARFSSAWGSGITLVPVSNFSALTAGDAIGLWDSHDKYEDDELAGG